LPIGDDQIGKTFAKEPQRVRSFLGKTEGIRSFGQGVLEEFTGNR